jgi:hypothetical protein
MKGGPKIGTKIDNTLYLVSCTVAYYKGDCSLELYEEILVTIVEMLPTNGFS